MGSFFTSVQVRSRALDLVIETLRAVAAKDGLEADADRTMLVSRGRIRTCSTTILVHDSEVLELRLFAAGKLVDRYNSCPTYFGEVSAAQKKAAAGKPERWTRSSPARAISPS